MRRIKNILVGAGLLLVAITFDLHLRRKTMERNSYGKLWLIVALTVVVTSLLTCCSRPVTAPEPQIRVVPYVPVVLLDSASSNDAETRCDVFNHAVVYIKERFLHDTTALRLLFIHEGTHVRQILAYPSCYGFLAKIRNEPGFRFDIEAEAYCAVWNAESNEKRPHIWTLGQIEDFLVQTTGTKHPLPCGGDNGRQRTPKTPP